MSITPKGYSRIYDSVTKRLRMEHDLIWERAHGPIPAGLDLHHINHDKLDNRIENLELLDPLTHKRHHSGYERRDGMWWKPGRSSRLQSTTHNRTGSLRGVDLAKSRMR